MPDASIDRSREHFHSPRVPAVHFPASYFEARGRFTEAALGAGFHVERLPISARGPGEEELSIDIASINLENCERCLFLLSGTHGVELLPGSVSQTHFLSDGELGDDSVGVVLVHALNPYGAAWNRRVNENNVDLNRNFRHPRLGWSGTAPVMQQLSHLFTTDGAFTPVRTPIEDYCKAHDTDMFDILDGQYDYPRRIFYGGARLEESAEKLMSWCRTRLGGVKKLVGLDFHTGLAAYGETIFIVHLADNSGLGSLVKETCGTRAWAVGEMPDSRIGVSGVVSGGVRMALPGARIHWVLQEFGVRPFLEHLDLFARENFDSANAALRPDHESRLALLESFCPADPAWRAGILPLARDGLALAKLLLEEPDRVSA